MLDFADVLGHRLPKTPQVPKIGPVMKILLAEDDRKVADFIIAGLSEHGIRSITSLTGARL